MNNIYPLRHHYRHTPVTPACRNFWIGYTAFIVAMVSFILYLIA